MSNDNPYRHNHYVPVWYQRRFLRPEQHKYWYLDLQPEVIPGGKRRRRDLLNWGPKKCFAQNDLYTTNLGALRNTDIERFFFSSVEQDGKTSVEYFGNFKQPSVNGDLFRLFVKYMSLQKLRTPKGLSLLRQMARTNTQNMTLIMLQHIHEVYCAVWTECVWQIADAAASQTKFIISDHPVTVYNRACFPMSRYCTGSMDPDIRQVATHTYFPLSLDRVLILTNLSWVRNPYQKELAPRPNTEFFRNAIFKFTDIQTDRMLSEQEVIEINYVTKQRAYRYIAAAEEQWLYPERCLRNPHWRKLGDGYLFMPDPRHIHMGGEVVIGYDSGRSDAFSEYGHKPWDVDYKNEERSNREGAALERFKAEWAAKFGRKYRGITYDFHGANHPPRIEESGELHTRRLEIDRFNRQRTGDRQRRRRLTR